MAPENAKKRRGSAAAFPSPPNAPNTAPQHVMFADTTYIPAWKCYLLLLIAACWSPVSQLTLSPTHGSIPAALYHSQLTANLLLLTVPLDIALLYILPLKEKPFFLPVLAFSVPAIQYYLTPLTLEKLGPAWSALVIEFFTYGMIVALTLNVTWQRFGRFVPPTVEQSLRTFIPPVIASAVLFGFERGAQAYLPALFGTSVLFSRAFTPAILAFCMAALLPSKYLLFAALPISHNLFLNPHTPISVAMRGLNETLSAVNYTLLDRREGPTGYISVLQNNQDGFRVMRCDHSLLGGEWVFGVGQWPGGEGFTDRRAIVGEPVYTVFVMLEAVRLVQDAVGDGSSEEDFLSIGVPDKDAKALVVGLGIGTTPAALVAHGIETTVVEIDPVVFDFARDYFALPANLTGIVQDATVYVHHTKDKFDYIVHDVFTGGAEPAELFTVEFIKGLKRRLNDNGVIAINYAGDLLLPPAALIVRTTLAVFPNCRMFREDAPKEDPTTDFTNIIFFCRKTKRPFAFREATQGDFLQTMSRQQGLAPKFEVDPQSFDLTGGTDGIGRVLSDKNVTVLQKWRAPGAMGHWEVMRTVLPPIVWENW